jgi:hypothetical protein
MNSSAIWGWFPLLTIPNFHYPSEGEQWGRDEIYPDGCVTTCCCSLRRIRKTSPSRCHQSGQARSSAQFQDTAPPHAATFEDLRGSPWGNPWGNPDRKLGKTGWIGMDRDFYLMYTPNYKWINSTKIPCKFLGLYPTYDSWDEPPSRDLWKNTGNR